MPRPRQPGVNSFSLSSTPQRIEGCAHPGTSRFPISPASFMTSDMPCAGPLSPHAQQGKGHPPGQSSRNLSCGFLRPPSRPVRGSHRLCDTTSSRRSFRHPFGLCLPFFWQPEGCWRNASDALHASTSIDPTASRAGPHANSQPTPS